MAEIDKSLPNEVRKEIEIEGPEVAAEENIEIQEDYLMQVRLKLHH
jgi:hypothetical protein